MNAIVEPTYDVDVIARMLKLTPRRVQQLVRENVLPRARHGQYPLISCMHGYIDYLLARANQGSRKLTEDARLKHAQANLRELEYSKQRGELIEVDAVTAVMAECVVTMKNALNALPARVAVDCVGKNAGEIKAILQDESRTIQNDFAAGLESVSRDLQRIIRARERSKKASA